MSESQQNNKYVKGLSIRFDESSKTYNVSIDTECFRRGEHQNDMFFVWLYSRVEEETINLSFCGGTAGFSPEVYLTLINALALCTAKLIVNVDHITDGIKAYIALMADTIVASDFGMLRIPPIVQRDGEVTLQNQQKASSAFFFSILQSAVERGILTEEELTSVRSGSVVYIYPDTLKKRLS